MPFVGLPIIPIQFIAKNEIILAVICGVIEGLI